MDAMRFDFADGSFVALDPLTPFWHAHPRKGRVLKNGGDGLAAPYPSAEAAVAALREAGYAAGPPVKPLPARPRTWTGPDGSRVFFSGARRCWYAVRPGPSLVNGADGLPVRFETCDAAKAALEAHDAVA